jgi:dTDP-4-dehydrorhamnose 3,5-epimerase-like enzyme
MKVTPLILPDVLLIEPQVFADERGFFFESFNQERFEKSGGQDRSLMPGAVLGTWKDVTKNFSKYQDLFGDNFVSVDTPLSSY